MKKSTKENIIEIAIRRFNEEGFAKVSMYEIAKEIGLSRGNLAYHFKDKDALLEAITCQMWAEFEQKRSNTLTYPSFKNITEEFHQLYSIQKAYSFIFLDTQVLQHPLVKNQFKEMTTKTIQGNKTIIAFAIKMGNMKPEAIPGTYHYLALITWMVSCFWLSQQIIREDFSEKIGDRVLWSLLLPYLTEKGKEALEKYLGEAFMDSMGEAFELSIEEMI
jgi:AcrR family transcriptional regulator